jgi:hypothetical protein
MRLKKRCRQSPRPVLSKLILLFLKCPENLGLRENNNFSKTKEINERTPLSLLIVWFQLTARKFSHGLPPSALLDNNSRTRPLLCSG